MGFFEKNNKNLYTKKLLKLLNINEISYKKNPSEKDIVIAKALQFCAEEIALHYLKYLFNLTKCKNLVISGGFFMNSVFNGEMRK